MSIDKQSPHDRYGVTGAWLEGDDVGDREFIKIGDIELESGEILPDVTIAYQSWGTLNAARDLDVAPPTQGLAFHRGMALMQVCIS